MSAISLLFTSKTRYIYMMNLFFEVLNFACIYLNKNNNIFKANFSLFINKMFFSAQKNLTEEPKILHKEATLYVSKH